MELVTVEKNQNINFIKKLLKKEEMGMTLDVSIVIFYMNLRKEDISVIKKHLKKL